MGAQPEYPNYQHARAYRSASSALDSSLRHDVSAHVAAVPNGVAEPATAITAVLADPYPLWLEAVERVLRPLGVAVAGKANSPADALSLLEGVQPALLMTDLDFGKADEGGIPYLKEALAVCPDLKVIVLAMYEESKMVAEAIAAGARAYALKHVLPDDLAAAVRQIFHHSIFFAPTDGVAAITTAATETVLPLPAPVTSADEKRPGRHQLTRRELEILTLVADGLPNGDIARRLWITEQTVKFHLSNIYRKLGVSNRTQASRWAVLQQPSATNH